MCIQNKIKRAFTLVELLVVIAIIAIFPFFSIKPILFNKLIFRIFYFFNCI